MMSMSVSRRRPFLSVSETLILAGLLIALAASVVAGLWAWHRHQRLVMARSDLRALEEAVQRFHREYGSWPGAANSRSADIRYGRQAPNREVLNILQAREGRGNEQHAGNEQQIVFIEVEPYETGVSGLNSEGDFLDPWGTPYQMVFDANFDNVCDVEKSVYGRLIGRGYALWSCGPDRQSDTPDDLLGWSMP